MNFLAHIFLSNENPELTAGNFMADSVKGAAIQHYSQGIQQGIRIHREIDSYTDSHPVFRQTKARLSLSFGKYAPVVADVFYDHFLATQWNNYSDDTLRKYVDSSYLRLEKYYDQFPFRTQRFYQYMMKYDILYAYSTVQGIDRVMNGMAQRAAFESGMENSARELLNNYEAYREEFKLFFPALQEHIRTFTH